MTSTSEAGVAARAEAPPRSVAAALTSPLGRPLSVMVRIGGLLALIGAVYYLRVKYHSSDDVLFLGQDLPVLPLMALAILLLAWKPPALPLARLAPLWTPWRLALVAAGATFVIGAAAASLVFGGYRVALDEVMADFDATIFAHGQALAPVPTDWRPFVQALQPLFGLPVPGHAAWASAYLPLNAAVRALASLVGAQGLVNPAWTGLGVLATFGVGRQLWPERPWLAAGAAALVATSAQALVMAMTAFATPAHLALNMAWLWLFLRGGRASHALAIVVAFAACGLHQFVFHPLFAAPFVLQLWLDRRWRLAGIYSFAYGAICLFWIFYWSLLFRLAGVAPTAASQVGGSYLVHTLAGIVTQYMSPLSFGLMAEALVRFATWQSLLCAALALIGAGAGFRAKGHFRALALGVVFTLVAMLVVMPAQTLGWGYRYLHGLLGSVALLAMLGWTSLTDPLAAPDRARANSAFVTACLVSALALAPLRAWQAHQFAAPFARAETEIRAAPADVVLVDNSVTYFDAGSVVRNDPYLRNTPKVMLLSRLSESDLRSVCARYRVLNFDGADIKALGAATVQLPRTPSMERLRALRARLGCDRRIGTG